MLKRTYSKAALAVLQKDFDAYIAQYKNRFLPKVLERASMQHFRYKDVTLVILTWDADWGFMETQGGVDGDSELIAWFGEKPFRLLLIGGEMVHNEMICNMERGNLDAFLASLDKENVAKVFSKVGDKMMIQEYLYLI